MKWIKTVGPTVLSSTTSQKLGAANFKLPADARTLLAIIPYCEAPEGKTATEAVMASIEVKSDSNALGPYIALCAPIGSYLGADGGSIRGLAPIYPVNAPVKGGSEIELWGTGLINHTIEPYMQCDLILANFPVAGPRFKAKIGTLTAMGAATAGETKGSGIRLEGGHTIKEVMGYAIGTTVAAAKGITGKFRLSSSGLKGMGDVEFAAEPVGGAKTALDAAGTAAVIEVAHLTRRRALDIPITDPVDIDDYFNLGVAVTTAGKFILGVIFQ